jgi:hypothetical protein
VHAVPNVQHHREHLPSAGFDPTGTGLAKIESNGGVSLIHDGSAPTVMRRRIRDLAQRLQESAHSIEEPPVEHEVIGGLYLRRLHIPKNVMLVGMIHLKHCVNVVERGDLTVLTELGCARLRAGYTGVSKPGTQKVGLTHADTTFVNVFRTDETDIERIEAETMTKWFGITSAEADRLDYAMFLDEYGLTEEAVRRASDDMSDQFGPVIGQASYYLARSPIQGEGCFAFDDMQPGAYVGAARIGMKRTMLGRKLNHSLSPNCRCKRADDGSAFVIVARELCAGDELTIDYREVMRLNTELTLQGGLQ